MKKSINFIAVILFAISIIACKKENVTPVTPSVNGYWTGSVTPTGSSIPQFIGILYKANGIAIGYSQIDTTLATKVAGTYSIGTDSIRSSFPYGSASTELSAKLNTVTAMSGTARRTNSAYSATYSITKQ